MLFRSALLNRPASQHIASEKKNFPVLAIHLVNEIFNVSQERRHGHGSIVFGEHCDDQFFEPRWGGNV